MSEELTQGIVPNAEEELKAQAEEAKVEVAEEVKVEEAEAMVEPKVEEKAEAAEAPADAKEQPTAGEEAETERPVDYSGMNLQEIIEAFGNFLSDPDLMKKPKAMAEAIKVAFYKRLGKEKMESGIVSPAESAREEQEDAEAQEQESNEAQGQASVQEVAPEVVKSDAQPEAAKPEPAKDETADEVQDNPFAAIEAGFKELYAKYRHARAEYTKKQDEERAASLVKKQAIIEDLKALVEKDEDVSRAFPELRAIQDRWREAGPVPATNRNEINETYQFYIEQFYDKVQINREMRDLDFKKNLEAKTSLCEAAEKLEGDEDVVDAFKELQKLHAQWKELGPVAKEFRDSIWERFRTATSAVNKAYQAHFEGIKEQMAENLTKKVALCEKAEAIADAENITVSSQWNEMTTRLLELQKEWKGIGFATRKENQKVYDRFRAACDKFFSRKKEFYSQMKVGLNENVAKKEALIAQAEALKDSEDWKTTSDKLIDLQRQWKESGAVPRKKAEQLWTRFRAACDVFFDNRDKNQPRNNYRENLKAKQALVEEIKNFNTDDEQLLSDARANFEQRWRDIGFVPMKDKEEITKAYEAAMSERFPDWKSRSDRGFTSRRDSGSRPARQGGNRPMTEKDRLVAKYNALEQEIETSENNIGFFAAGKNSAALIDRMRASIEESKKQLEALRAKIREAEAKEESKGEE